MGEWMVILVSLQIRASSIYWQPWYSLVKVEPKIFRFRFCFGFGNGRFRPKVSVSVMRRFGRSLVDIHYSVSHFVIVHNFWALGDKWKSFCFPYVTKRHVDSEHNIRKSIPIKLNVCVCVFVCVSAFHAPTEQPTHKCCTYSESLDSRGG